MPGDGIAGSTDQNRDLRAAIEVDLRNSGARQEDLDGDTILYPLQTEDMRVRLSPDSSMVERVRPDGEWETLETAPYPVAWDVHHHRRVRHAYRVLMWSGVWVLLGVVMAMGILLDASGWQAAVSRYVPLGVGLILWFAKIPFEDFYPGAFVAGGIFGLSVVIAEAGWSWWWLLYGAVTVLLSVWGWLHCGGPELIGYLRSMLSPDPRRAASLRLYDGDRNFRGRAS